MWSDARRPIQRRRTQPFRLKNHEGTRATKRGRAVLFVALVPSWLIPSCGPGFFRPPPLLRARLARRFSLARTLNRFRARLRGEIRAAEFEEGLADGRGVAAAEAGEAEFPVD